MSDEANAVSVTAAVRGGWAEVRVVGGVDLATAAQLDEVLCRLVDEGVTHLSIDLGGVPFMDSDGLHPIVRLVRQRPVVTVTVINPQPGIARLFWLHGVASLLTEAVA